MTSSRSSSNRNWGSYAGRGWTPLSHSLNGSVSDALSGTRGRSTGYLFRSWWSPSPSPDSSPRSYDEELLGRPVHKTVTEGSPRSVEASPTGLWEDQSKRVVIQQAHEDTFESEGQFEGQFESESPIRLPPREKSRFYRRTQTWSSVSQQDPQDVVSRNSTNKGRQASSGSVLCWRSAHVIDPRNSNWLYAWDLLHAVQLAAISFMWPYETAFLNPEVNWIFFINCFFDVTLMMDMAMQLFIAQPDPVRPERVIKSPRIILRNYLQGWFLCDFLSVLPVDVFYVFAEQNRHSGQATFLSLRSLRLLRVVRLMRLMRFIKLLDRWNTSFGISYTRITMMKLIGTLALCCHWMACLWGGLAISVDKQHNWLAGLRVAKGGPHFPDDDHLSLYSVALYWAIITLTSIGYGDITPQTILEYRVATVCSSIMAGIWAYIIGAICGIVSTMDQHDIVFKRTMDDLNWFMKDKEMPTAMRQRLRRYFYEAKEMSKQRVEKEVITQMSPLLQGEVSMFMHQRWICKVWYLRDMNREIIVWAARNLTLMVFAPNEEVLDERTLFIVQRGVCAHKGKILASGDVWGEDMLLSNPFLRDQCKARAMSHLSVLTLHIEDLFEVVVCFAEARARLRWAQIQIAMTRGIVRVAKKIKVIKATTGVSPTDLPEQKRVAFYREVLQGEGEDDVNVPSDPFGLRSRPWPDLWPPSFCAGAPAPLVALEVMPCLGGRACLHASSHVPGLLTALPAVAASFVFASFRKECHTWWYDVLVLWPDVVVVIPAVWLTTVAETPHLKSCAKLAAFTSLLADIRLTREAFDACPDEEEEGAGAVADLVLGKVLSSGKWCLWLYSYLLVARRLKAMEAALLETLCARSVTRLSWAGVCIAVATGMMRAAVYMPSGVITTCTIPLSLSLSLFVLAVLAWARRRTAAVSGLSASEKQRARSAAIGWRAQILASSLAFPVWPLSMLMLLLAEKLPGLGKTSTAYLVLVIGSQFLHTVDSLGTVLLALALSGALTGAAASGKSRAVLRRQRKQRAACARKQWKLRQADLNAVGSEAERAWDCKVQELAQRALSVSQLLDFYRQLPDAMSFDPGRHTTRDVVFQAIIPATAEAGCSYSEAMAAGHGELPDCMVTHNWGNLFQDLLAAVLADSLGENDFEKIAYLLRCDVDMITQWIERANVGSTTYWICAFAVNQHKTICKSSHTKTDTVTGRPYPDCRCRTTHVDSNAGLVLPDGRSIESEVNKFDSMMTLAKMSKPKFKQVVAVDSDFKLFTRAWCIAELVAASNLGMVQCLKIRSAENLEQHTTSLSHLQIQDMEASVPEDKDYILSTVADPTTFNAELRQLILRDLLPAWNAMDAEEQAAEAGRIVRWFEALRRRPEELSRTV